MSSFHTFVLSQNTQQSLLKPVVSSFQFLIKQSVKYNNKQKNDTNVTH